MSTLQASVGDTFIDQFSAFEDDGVAKRSGLQAVDFTVTVWMNGAVKSTTTTITEIGTSGEYKISFTVDMAGTWKVEVRLNFSGEILYSVCQVGAGGGPTGVQRLLGLMHENAVIDKQLYDAQGQLVSARLRVFDSAANVPNNPDGTETAGLLYTFNIESRWGGLNRNIFYKLTRL